MPRAMAIEIRVARSRLNGGAERAPVAGPPAVGVGVASVGVAGAAARTARGPGIAPLATSRPIATDPSPEIANVPAVDARTPRISVRTPAPNTATATAARTQRRALTGPAPDPEPAPAPAALSAGP